ncbi:N-acetyltransferase [Fistulina hepatica ATCC 64428]|uniref:N-acetyltransferase n=1 Tax=Fistulina hepatica ATCC 64428 TaxID=1128425 RepID=A0A0D7AMT7_9AGAR|nr:N-acetyltransferase [Fistulina hepatica ATCC 64428]
MSILRSFHVDDMFKFNNVNLDVWSETFGIGFYLLYLSQWPELCCVQQSPGQRIMGYIIGKAEGNGPEWHTHISALSVAPEYRRLGMANKLVALFEHVSEELYQGFFIDLFVRCANHIAESMYERLGYSVYRRVREYYGSLGLGKSGKDEEDAFDMRKPLSKDITRRSVRTNGRDIVVSAHDVS